MSIFDIIKNIFMKDTNTQTSEYLDSKYVIVTNVYSYPILVSKNSSLVNDIDSADYHFDESVPEGKGRIYKFSEGLKVWGISDRHSNICPSPVLDSEKKLFKKDKERIIAYAKSLKLNDLIIDTLASGCDGYSLQEPDTFYDENGNKCQNPFFRS